MSEWRDIATAPKDGTRVLLWLPGCRHACIGQWDSQNHNKNPIPFWRTDPRWRGIIDDRHDQPSRWMPLPNPPENLS